MIRTAILLSLVLVFHPAGGSAQASRTIDPSTYTVTFDMASMTARVEGTTRVTGGALELGSTGAWALPEQDWRAWIRDLVVREMSGDELSVRLDSAGGWTIGGGRLEGPVNVSYQVDLGYVGRATDLPRTTTGYGDEDGFFSVTTPFFVHDDAAGPFEVTLSAPAGWHLATAWPQVGDEAAYHVGTVEALTENALVVSRTPPIRIAESGFDIRIGLLEEFQAIREVIRPVVTAQLRAALTMMPHPGPSQHLLVFFPDQWDTGEALEASSVMSSQQAPTFENVSLWGKTLAHELVHVWVGHAVSGTDWAASQWFSEGTTEYLASLIQLRAGVISEEDFFDHMRKRLHLYLLFDQGSVHDDVSLVEAGQQKARNNAALYDGGALTAFCFDGMIREATRGERELSDVVAGLMANAGADGYSNDEIIREVVRHAGVAARALYDGAVMGKERLPLEACFARYGYHLGINALDVELHPAPGASKTGDLMRLALRSATPLTW